MAAEAAVEAIHEAVEEGNAEAVERMLDEDPQLLFSTKYGQPLLTRAALEGHVGIVKLLLERGADVNAPDEDEYTALHYASYHGHEEVVSLLVSSGADVYRRNASGDTALMLASQRGQLAVVRLLVRFMGGCRLNGRAASGCTALWYACFRGHAGVVRALLLAEADHTIANNYGTTLQRVAQGRGYHECAGLIQWWEGELARAYVLHKARTLHDNTATHQQAPAAPVPAYLSPRVQEGTLMPSVEVVTIEQGGAEKGEEGGQQKEEEVGAMVGFVVKDLAAELYTELLAGLHH